MRFAGTIPQEIKPLIAGASTEAEWPSILRPKPKQTPVYKYDEQYETVTFQTFH